MGEWSKSLVNSTCGVCNFSLTLNHDATSLKLTVRLTTVLFNWIQIQPKVIDCLGEKIYHVVYGRLMISLIF